MGNTGNKIYQTLIEKLSSDNTPTGFTKPNVISDPDYIPPVVDTIMCATSTSTTTTTIAPNCGGLAFNSGSYYEIYTDDEQGFHWHLPVNMSLITSITSWSIRVQTSQSCRTSTGFITSSLGSWDVTVNGVGTALSGIIGDGDHQTGNLNTGSFWFNPVPYLSFPPNPCGGTKKVWQNQTTVTLDVTYVDLCGNTRTHHSVSYISEYRVTITSNSTSEETCLLEDTRILLANNDEKLIQNVVEGDILRGIKVSKEKFNYDTFKDSHFIHVEVERVTDYEVDELIIIFDLHMTSTHKHLVLRKNTTCFVVEAKDIVQGDKIYNFEEMKFKEVKEIKTITGKFKVYNIEIKGPYQFYFANDQLTHNKKVPPKEPIPIPTTEIIIP